MHPKTSASADLVPVGNLVSLLLPAAAMVGVALWESTPGTSYACDEPHNRDPLHLTVAVTAAGFEISTAHAVEPAFIPCRAPCADPSDFPVSDLTRALISIKNAHPNERFVAIAAEGRVAYAVLMSTMDAAAGPDGRRFPDRMVVSLH